MNISESSKAANALGGKTARACDSCLLKRARWFCTADDAFLCQACDASVHSANQLASRHERVRLETSSFKGKEIINSSTTPAWHQGFTRKARTPRQPKSTRAVNNEPLPLVPEINSEDLFLAEENEDQLLYRVPVFDPFDDTFFTHEMVKGELEEEEDDHELNIDELLLSGGDAKFAGDVESLLGMERVLDCEHDLLENIITTDHEVILGHGKSVKVEEEEDDDNDDDDEVKAVIACHFDPALDMELNWDFDYGCNSSITIGEEVEEIKEIEAIETRANNNTIESIGSESQVKRRMLLRLNYDAVIAAWASQGVWGRSAGGNDAGREARVSRYREKRRTRLFSKKIRYQVRKLNAEKRPRMKGRFVKRTNFSGSSLPYLNLPCQ
ncbi:hypothetical protein BUALT_Bualt07G0080000 [Buddleja alternifolia]|uniref:Uncharacterized protein n=1 Tax=Buddleja alternifolia TaxID=168488 RepID=A0AAV6X974_9LAMI|nr:hypothetical protein BUALT_Bualt07G0080000 [Buddleja alternifolia]